MARETFFRYDAIKGVIRMTFKRIFGALGLSKKSSPSTSDNLPKAETRKTEGKIAKTFSLEKLHEQSILAKFTKEELEQVLECH